MLIANSAILEVSAPGRDRLSWLRGVLKYLSPACLVLQRLVFQLRHSIPIRTDLLARLLRLCRQPVLLSPRLAWPLAQGVLSQLVQFRPPCLVP